MFSAVLLCPSLGPPGWLVLSSLSSAARLFFSPTDVIGESLIVIPVLNT